MRTLTPQNNNVAPDNIDIPMHITYAPSLKWASGQL